jgi:hypothetical protein
MSARAVPRRGWAWTTPHVGCTPSAVKLVNIRRSAGWTLGSLALRSLGPGSPGRYQPRCWFEADGAVPRRVVGRPVQAEATAWSSRQTVA